MNIKSESIKVNKKKMKQTKTVSMSSTVCADHKMAARALLLFDCWSFMMEMSELQFYYPLWCKYSVTKGDTALLWTNLSTDPLVILNLK